MLLYGVQHTEVPNLGVTLFDGYSYDGLNAVIGVQHTEVANLENSPLGMYLKNSLSSRYHFKLKRVKSVRRFGHLLSLQILNKDIITISTIFKDLKISNL